MTYFFSKLKKKKKIQQRIKKTKKNETFFLFVNRKRKPTPLNNSNLNVYF